MKRYKIINMANFNAGRVQLSDAQAKPRLHNLKHIKDDIYEIVQTVQFKAGEELGYDGEINKLLMLDIKETEAEEKGKLTETETRKKVIAAAEVKTTGLEKDLIEDAHKKRTQEIRKKK